MARHQITLAQAACLYTKGQVFKFGRKTYEFLTTVSDVTPIQHNIIIVAYNGTAQQYECINVTGKENYPCYSIIADSKNVTK